MPSPAPQLAVASSSPAASPAGIRVLLIEDDRLIIEYYRTLLDNRGMSHVAAASLAEAVAILDEDLSIDLVIADLFLPDSDGTSALQALSPVVERRPWVQALVITGRPTVDAAVEALRLEAVDFLRKPVRPAEFLDAVDRAVDRIGRLRLRRQAATETTDRRVRQIYAALRGRRLRSRFFGETVSMDPMWEMLLDLALARLLGRRTYLTSLCIAAGIPTATALRRITDLEQMGLLTRSRDVRDARRVFVEITEDGMQRMLRHLERTEAEGASP